MFFRASDHLDKRMFKDAKKFVGHFGFRPTEALQTLHPLEVGNDHTAGIAENVRDNKDFVPALLKNQICFWCGRTIRAFRQNATL